MGMELALAAEEMLELVKSRSSPGVLILDLDNRLLYSNVEALNLLENPEHIPSEITRLCDEIKAGAALPGSCALFWGQGGAPYSLRAFLIGAQAKDRPATHVMVLVEKIAGKHNLNLQRARAHYGLSDREIEVVALVAQGLANKEIGAKLFLSEHTVKDHLKNIMRKMGAVSRSGISYLLK